MSIFKKIFKTKVKESKREKEVNSEAIKPKLSTEIHLDDSFTHHFIEKGGKFLYCTSMNDIYRNLELIMRECGYKELLCFDHDLIKITKHNQIKTYSSFSKDLPFFTPCEYLTGDQGDIMFTSNQLGSNKLANFSENFIVYATTSQIAKNTSEGLSGIKQNYSGNIPNNISSIKYYTLKKSKESFMNYGNTNSKNLYLLLFEDL